MNPAFSQVIINYDRDNLKLFLTVARQTNLEKSASQLQMDATTLSRRIKRLETVLKTTLFERTRKGHVLTPSGENYAAHVESIESHVFEIVSETASEQSASGCVRLGVPEGIGATIIAPALAAFKESNPDIIVDLIAMSGFASVPKREADMSVLLTRPTAGRLKIRRLTTYSLGLYGSIDYLSKRKPILDTRDLNSHMLVGYVDDLIYSRELRYFDDLLPVSRQGL
ncbi:MAG: LysR family transcriptional regulator [Henriciella sp.]